MRLKTQKMKNSKGITLIALVITIIVLLILAGVSIATLTGDNGLLTKSNEAVEENVKGEERDKIALAYQAVKLDELADSDSSDDVTADNLKTALENNGIKQATVTAEADGSLTVQMPSGNKYKVTQAGVITYIGTGEGNSDDIITPPPPPPSLPTTVDEAIKQKTVFPDNTKLTDDYGNPVTIPEGFKIAEESATYVGGGIVIEDAKYEGTKGSQFVWIPVGEKIYKNKEKTEFETITLGRYSFTKNSDGTITTRAYTGSYFFEENSNDTQNLKKYGNSIAEDIEAFKASTGADKNGGYYIGRYEAGLDITSKLDTTDMTEEFQAPNKNWTGWSKQDGTEAQIVCKQGQQVWNYITQNKAAELSRSMYEKKNFTSDLINSYAWDTAIVFIQKFGEEDNSSTYSCQPGEKKDRDNPSSTGSGIIKNTNKLDMQCNIFDMAGNCYEWSTETYSTSNIPCVYRGGLYSLDSVSYTKSRNFTETTGAGIIYAFRPLLYIDV